jgi:phage baseplate assembly protein V
MSTAELHRLLNNLIRVGTIEEIDHAAGRCRVKSGENLTDWLKWIELRAGDSKTWNPPTKGEQCIVLSPGGELGSGLVITGINSDSKAAPSESPAETKTVYPDGATVLYNHVTSHMDVTGIKTANVVAAETITLKAGQLIKLDAPQVTSTGKTTSQGLLTYMAGMSGTGGSGGNTQISGEIKHSGNYELTGDMAQRGNFTNEGKVISNGIELDTHTHSGVQPGGSSTGSPQ